MYVHRLVLISEIIKGLRDVFLRWEDSFQSKGLEVSLGKAKVMVCNDITHG